MKLTKEEVENCARVHEIMMEKADRIWTLLRNLDPERYEYFSTVDELSFGNTDGTVSVRGWDGSGACFADIPIQYFYDDDWLEQAKKEVAVRAEQKRLMEEEKKRISEEEKEKRERSEYERLKKKFG